MCEIAVLDPSEYSSQRLTEAAMDIYRTQRSSLGVVLAREVDDRTRFEYDIYKAVEPDRQELYDFINELADGATRCLIHGRLATHGEISEKHAHPLEIDCEQCNIDYLLHNGIVYQHEKVRAAHEDHGHTYHTEVDSEVIAHDFKTVPTDFEHDGIAERHSREPAFILMNDKRIFVRTSGVYCLAEDGTMAQSRREVGPALESDYREVILQPKNNAR